MKKLLNQTPAIFAGIVMALIIQMAWLFSIEQKISSIEAWQRAPFLVPGTETPLEAAWTFETKEPRS